MTFQTIPGLALFFSLAMAVGLSQAQLTTLPATPYDGLKKTLSVDQFLATESTGGVVTADGMSSLLTNALIKDGRFIVVERPGLAGLQLEQALGQAGAATAATAAGPGQLIGASAIVRGVVTKYQAAASGSGVSVSGPLANILPFLNPSAGLNSTTAMMEISLRLIDTTTGQVISTSTAQGSASSTGVNLRLVNPNTGLSVGGESFQTTPIGQAGEQAIVKAVELIALSMRSVAWSAMVIEANDGMVYINAGADRNVQVGLGLSVYRQGKVFTDPSTGVVLDVDMKKIGRIRIGQVREKLSTAAVINGETPVRGDLIKLE